jgi:hypothetical protein
MAVGQVQAHVSVRAVTLLRLVATRPGRAALAETRQVVAAASTAAARAAAAPLAVEEHLGVGPSLVIAAAAGNDRSTNSNSSDECNAE